MKKKICIIAEAGVNHNGSLGTAKRLIRAAKESGADIIKFQTARLDSLVSKDAPMARYQVENTGRRQSQKDMLRKLLLPYDDFIRLSDYCGETGIRFLSTPFDTDSIRFLDPLQDIWKVPSGEITDYPYLVEIAGTGKEVLLSTGMSTMKEVDAALDVLRGNGAGKVTLLHCTTQYPAPVQDVNLRAMLTLREHCGCETGYSDHTPGIEIAVAAAALGASVIEKHITLDRNMEGPDHKASLEPDGFAAMVRAIRNVEAAMGSGVKEPCVSEQENMAVARKSLVASRDIGKGERLSEENMTTKRPGNGISPMRWNDVAGTCAVRDFKEDEQIEI